MHRLAILLIVLGGCDRILGLDTIQPPADAPPPGTWQQVVAGDHYTCALTNENELYCWGYNYFGQLGSSHDEAQLDVPTLVSGAWSSMALGKQHGCAIKTDASLWCWGQDFYGQLGTLAAGIEATVPTVVDAAPRTQWSNVATFYFHTCAIASDQTLWCWGSNASGQANPNGTEQIATPTQIDVAGSPAWKAVSVGLSHSCALTVGGTIWCWGANNIGQSGAPGTSDVPPTQLPGSNYAAVSAGDDFTCAIDSDKHVLCWGANRVGQLGRGGTGSSQPLPALIAGNDEYVGISASWSTACALTTDHALECWGDLTGTAPAVASPTALASSTVWRQFAAGRTHMCGIDTTGTLACAGDNTAGQLGQPAPDTTVPQTIISSVTNVTEVALGEQFGCAVAGGNLECWGDNAAGQVATGDDLRRLTPTLVPGFALGKLSLGGDHACGISATSRAYCWGNNPFGGLGNGTTIGAQQPVQLSLTTVSHIGLGDQQTCATANGANGYCWGRGMEGQLANGAMANSTTPAVMTLTAGQVTNLGPGFEFTCWVEGSKAYCAGVDNVDQLGNSDASMHVSVGTGSLLNVFSLGAGREHTCALAGVGNGKDIYCWGRNYEGELGNGTTSKSSAIPLRVGAISVFTAVASGDHHSCGLTTTNTILCWGQNDRGQLGDGTRIGRVSPVTVMSGGAALGGVTAIAAGGSTTCALVGGALECWGDNGFGSLGVTTGWLNDFTPLAPP